MLKNILRVAVVLFLAVIAFFYYRARNATEVVPDTVFADEAPTVSPQGFRIAFGSCNRQDRPQGYWSTIARHAPDVWLWLGDNVYADTEDMAAMAADYASLKTNADYAAFLESTPAVYGTWDDHDYGINDGGKEWHHKAAAKTLLLDFLEVPTGAEVRTRPGVYQSYLTGTADHPIKVILLDTRSFRDPVASPTRPGHRYGQDPEGDILGAEQWDWLREQLTDSPAAAHLIASSIQVLPQDHGYEKWDLFPTARQRLLDLLSETRPALPLLLSGDRHLAEISRMEHRGYAIHEVTASGLTHAYEGADEVNQHRISGLYGRKNYGLLHYLPVADSLRLLAEIRAIDSGTVLADLALGGGQTDDLRALVIPPTTVMPNQLKECPASPNCVSTLTEQKEKLRAPIAYVGTLEEAKEKLKNVVEGMSRTRLRKESDNYLHYTFKTFPLPFIDDVEFIFDDQSKEIHYRSASRVGHSDLGVNGRRMEKIAKAFHAQ